MAPRRSEDLTGVDGVDLSRGVRGGGRRHDLGAIALIPAVLAVIRVWKAPEHTAKLIPAQRNTLLAFVLCAALAGFGLLIA